MGLFKGMRDISKLSKQAKELQHQQQAQAGYEPGLRGAIHQMEDQLGQMSGVVSGLMDQNADRARIVAVGIDAVGTVVAMGTPARGTSTYNLDIDLQVDVPGRAPYRIANQYLVPASAALGPGVRVPLKVAPEDASKIAVLWEQMETGPARGVVRPVPGASPAPPPPAPPVQGAGAGTVDRLAELERLAALHGAGALTDDEFARMKSAILNS